MREKRQSGDTNKMYTPDDTTDNARVNTYKPVNTAQWQDQGFPTAETAVLATTIASAATSPAARHGCLIALVHSLTRKEPQEHERATCPLVSQEKTCEQAIADARNTPSPLDPTGVRVLQALPQESQRQLPQLLTLGTIMGSQRFQPRSPRERSEWGNTQLYCHIPESTTRPPPNRPNR